MDDFFLHHGGLMDDFFLHDFGWIDGWLFLHRILDWKDKLLSITLDVLEEFFLNHQWMDGWLSFFSINLDG
jgi:hypothetical protein